MLDPVSINVYEVASKRLFELLEEQRSELAPAAYNYLRYSSLLAQDSVIQEMAALGSPEAQQPLKVVDLGTGEGLLACALADAGCEVMAVDYYLDGGLATREHENLTYQSQNFDDATWSLPSDYYDLVISVDVVEHIRPVKRFVGNAARLLKPGGHLILHTPNYARLTTRLRAAANVIKPAWPIPFDPFVHSEPFTGHCFEYTADQLDHLVRSVGLTPISASFPKAVGWGRISERYRSLPRPIQLAVQGTWQLQEVARAVRPSLGNSQVIVAQK